MQGLRFPGSLPSCGGWHGLRHIKLDIYIKSYIILCMKDVRFMGSSLDDLKHFPAGARREAGFELSTVQAGLQPSTGSR